MAAERGIYESFMISERKLTDVEVGHALRQLTQELLEQGFQAVEDPHEVTLGEKAEPLVAWAIRRNWEDLFQEHPRHSDEDLAGLLRVPLASLDIWSTPERDSQGYLYYLEGFMSHMGVKVQRLSEDGTWETDVDTEELRLMALLRNWILRSNEAAGRAFRESCDQLLAQKRPGPVIHACQYLIGYTGDQDMTRRLTPFLSPAYRQLGVPFGPKR
jgi:hypothetical protein